MFRISIVSRARLFPRANTPGRKIRPIEPLEFTRGARVGFTYAQVPRINDTPRKKQSLSPPPRSFPAAAEEAERSGEEVVVAVEEEKEEEEDEVLEFSA